MLDALPDAVIMFDSCGHIEGSNRAMRDLLDQADIKKGVSDLFDFFQGLEKSLRVDLTYLLPGISRVIQRIQNPFFIFIKTGKGSRYGPWSFMLTPRLSRIRLPC